jgi:hypothetical protein
MPTLQDIRQQYPQYSDMSDQDLASAMHKKFYSDMPQTEFQAKIGMKPVVTGEVPVKNSFGGNVLGGLEKATLGDKQLTAKIEEKLGVIKPEQAQKIDTAVKMRNKQLGDLGIGGTIGEGLYTAPAALVGGPLVGGMLAGGLGAAINPVQGNNFWNDKSTDVLIGTALGGATSKAIDLVGGILGPTLEKGQKALLESGVNLPLGSLTGPIYRRAEEAMRRLPILGSFIRGAYGRAEGAMRTAMGDQALEPIGQKATAGLDGRELINDIYQKASAAYDKLLPQLQLTLTQDLSQKIGQIRQTVSRTLPEQYAKFQGTLKEYLGDVFARASRGTISGREMNKAMTDLRLVGERYGRSQSPAEQDFGHAIGKVRDVIDDALEAQNPQHGDMIHNVRQTWSMYKTLMNASVRRARSDGRFTSGDVLQEIKSYAKKTGALQRFATKGDRLLQEYAQYADKYLPGQMPDSGTPEALLWTAAVKAGIEGAAYAGGGAAAHAAGAPITAPALAAGAAATLPYTNVGTKVISKIAQPGPGRAAVAAAIRKGASPIGGVAGKKAAEYGGPQQ